MFYLYKITNNVNGKFYIGVHKTDNPNDDYMGSGLLIKKAIQKYGVESFTKEILETFISSDAAYTREKEIVNEDLVERDDVYNLSIGGNGSFHFANANKTPLKRSKIGRLGAEKLHSSSEEEKEETFKKISDALTGKKYRKGIITSIEDTSQKRSDNMKGRKLHPITRKWISKEEYDTLNNIKII